jgi:integrase
MWEQMWEHFSWVEPMARERKGSFVKKRGLLYARLTFVDEMGKRRELYQRVGTKTQGREWVRKKLREIEDYGQQMVDSDRMTFNQLADIYLERRLQPAEYHGDRKISGRRSYVTPRAYLNVLRIHFAKRRIKSITNSDVDKFRLGRLKTPTVHGKQRTIASVNRELEVLRAVMRFAVRSGWIVRSPFESGDILISKSDEVQRDRVLSRNEEERLLAACNGRRAHLRPLLIAALDTAMRRGELIQLSWADVDLENREINVRAMTTKTARSRTVPISSRLLAELERLQQGDGRTLVFGITDSVKNAFASACREAGIKGFRLHDCRHTAITRMIEFGMPDLQVMKISGHTQMTTFVKYVNAGGDAVKRAAAAIDAYNADSDRTTYVN